MATLTAVPTPKTRIRASAGMDNGLLDVDRDSFVGANLFAKFNPATGLFEGAEVATDWDSIDNKPLDFPPSNHTHSGLINPVAPTTSLLIEDDGDIVYNAASGRTHTFNENVVLASSKSFLQGATTRLDGSGNATFNTVDSTQYRFGSSTQKMWVYSGDNKMYLDLTGNTGFTFRVNSATDVLVDHDITGHNLYTYATSNGLRDVLSLRHNTTSTPGTNFGTAIRFLAESSTTADQFLGQLAYSWIDATHGTRKAKAILYVNDATAAREGIRVETDGSVAQVGIAGAVSAGNALTVNGLNSLFTSGGTTIVAAKSTLTGGAAFFQAQNDTGGMGGIGTYGTAFGTPELRNNIVVSAINDIILAANAGSSGGSTTTKVHISPGGYAARMAYFDNAGLTLLSGKTVNGVNASGVDIAGSNLLLAGGRATGTGAPGVVNIQTSTVSGVSSSTLQTLATRATFDAGSGANTTGFMLWDVNSGTLKRVQVGAADSGGVGYRLLRIAN